MTPLPAGDVTIADFLKAYGNLGPKQVWFEFIQSINVKGRYYHIFL